MIDWHSHVLPQMDDGSRSLEESLKMLSALSEQGISSVVATPHFYANEDSVESFLKRRAESFENLSACLTDAHPRVLRGAEVEYYSGIAKLKDLRLLAIEKTNLLLLEMPISKWSDTMANEIVELSAVRGFTIVIAHVERCLSLQSKAVLNKLLSNGILMQVNASFFRGFLDGRKAIGLLKSGVVHFIGSDCHNTTSRPPRIDTAYALIRKKLGESFIRQMNSYGHKLLGD
ncbi:MAG: capsular polysaccharide biosynthesis protein [Ruminococcaceae bacterium]|nr:capsular polysaccharide biosynthesis protein [Oscillospiraceae bacterium]